MNKRILIVDDSALVRKQLTGLLEPEGYICEVARNGADAVKKAVAEQYDAITMDINMPVMDGLSAVKEIMAQNPTPILMISSLTTEDAPVTLDALEYGAVDYVAKPGTLNVGLEQTSQDILTKLASTARISKRRLELRRNRTIPKPVQKAPRQERVERLSRPSVGVSAGGVVNGILLIGASTGGPNLIEDICVALPEDFPHPVCIVQHMPEKFTKAFAERLDRVSKLTVVETEHNMEFAPGTVYVAKGGVHTHFSKKVSGKIVLRHGQPTKPRYFTPSVDELFLSAAEVLDAKKVFAVELTGIGDDGAEGMMALKQKGAYTLAESEETATVYGMPKVCIETGAAQEALPFPKIVNKITQFR